MWLERTKHDRRATVRACITAGGATVAAIAIAACGGSGAGNAGTQPAILPRTSATPLPSTGAVIAGIVTLAAPDAYGPLTIGSTTYASADALTLGPLTRATVVIGPVPVSGATPPALVPPGNVVTMTDGFGAFNVTVPGAAVTAAGEPFVLPANAAFAFVPPALGFYIEVFGERTDGTSADVPIPLHRFIAAASSVAFHVSGATVAEAFALGTINADRAVAGAPPLTFDENAQEAARLHANDESTFGYTCHYDAYNIGPSSRYLAGGGLGLAGEAVALIGGADRAAAFFIAEGAFMAERSQTPPGAHARNVLDPSHRWAGLAASPDLRAPGFFNVDYELITPNAISNVVASSGYPASASCPAGTIDNDS